MVELAEFGPGVESTVIKKKKGGQTSRRVKANSSDNQRSGLVPDAGAAELNVSENSTPG